MATMTKRTTTTTTATTIAGALLVTLAATSATGCGGGPNGEDFIGLYTTTSHRENTGQGMYVPCTDFGPEIMMTSPSYAPYFAIVEDDFFEDPNALELKTCATPDLAACVDVFFPLTVGGDGFEQVDANTQTGGGTSCNLYASQTYGKLEGGELTIEAWHWDAFNFPGDCTLENAEALIETNDCRSAVRWRGTKL
jgi:hypothetical protein